MATRAVIARATGDQTFEGVYHHWDGYPSALGATLFELYNKEFDQNSERMLKVLIDDHKAGWSTINKADFTLASGFYEDRKRDNRPQCYCHGDRSEPANLLTERTASGCGCEYAYVFRKTDAGNDEMLVRSSYRDNGSKMIGAFGAGDPAATWRTIGVVLLNGAEPDWKAMQEMASC